MTRLKIMIFLFIKIFVFFHIFSCNNGFDYDIILRDGTVIDGTGKQGYKADIGITDGKIKYIGSIDERGKIDLRISGKIVAPGFIDTHSHHDDGMSDSTSMSGALTQGITTVFIGQDGSSVYPISDLVDELKNKPTSINIASYSGHNTIRDIVLGADFKREANSEEIQKMNDLLTSDLEHGAWGLSSGLEYDPGIYSNTEEVIVLAKKTSKYGGRYISHIRSEDRYFWKAIEEIIQIGKEAIIPIQISHIKLAMVNLLGKTNKLLARLNQARKDGIQVSADIYPYEYWQSTMQVLFPERDFLSKKSADFALSEITTPGGVIISHYSPNPKFEGLRLDKVASILGKDPSQALIDMIQATMVDGHSESIIAKSMSEDDIIALLNWEHTNLCTDGGSTGGHPRGFGSFSKVLGEYVRDKQYLTLEQAVHNMTGVSAKNLGLKNRGNLKPGMSADIVVFDPCDIIDRATFDKPTLVSRGIIHVIVNGKFAMKNEKITKNRPGIFLNRLEHSQNIQ